MFEYSIKLKEEKIRKLKEEKLDFTNAIEQIEEEIAELELEINNL